MQQRRLGRTGHQSSLAILGAAAFWDSTPDVVEACIGQAIDAGVNHLDIAPQYGAAERLVGPFLPALRDRLFVGCKTMRKNGDGVRAQLENSLAVLGCEQFDLYQLHAVTSVAELDERADAAAAILKARDEGLTRFVGITGHDWGTAAAQLEALRRYDLDTVMLPIAPRMWAHKEYRADAEALLAEAADRDVGVMVIKAAAARPKPEDSDATTWYEPYRSAAEIERGVRFALSIEGVTAFCTPGDVRLLPLALDAANAFEPMSDQQRSMATWTVESEPAIFPMPRA